MTQVDFYILPEQTIEQRQLFACRLVEKAFRLGHDIYLHCDSQQQAVEIDQLLWRFRPSSFLPHQIRSQQADEQPGFSQIEIGYGQDPGQHQDVLINLGLQIPEFFSRFQRVSEVVVTDPAVTAATRSNYKFYRHRGYPLNNHDMRK